MKFDDLSGIAMLDFEGRKRNSGSVSERRVVNWSGVEGAVKGRL
jgi:hypothetical protein